MGINYKGSQGQTERAIALQEEVVVVVLVVVYNHFSIMMEEKEEEVGVSDVDKDDL